MPKLIALLLTALLLGSLAVRAAAQSSGPTTAQDEMRKRLELFNELSREISKRLRWARENGNKLTELEALRALDAEYSAKGPDARQAVAVRLMEKTIELGNYAEALKWADVGSQKSPSGQPSDLSPLQGYEPVDALDAISSVAEAARIILINEAHHVPQHRAFTLELLRVLRKRGFTHFAAETLYESDGDLNERGYPTAASGAYINEPLYGDLVRTAIRLGYRVVPYEWAGVHRGAPGGGREQRERGQAQNLIDRILTDRPKARILVHAGYGHINEAGPPGGLKMMGQHLKEMTGIDPFTIDQTLMTEHSAPEYEHDLYRSVMDQKLISRPSVFRNAEGQWWTARPGVRDISLFHPRSVYRDGRPTWLRLGGMRTPYTLPEDVCGSAARCLVRARVASETPDAIPVDQVEVVSGRSIPALMLPPGEFVLEARDLTDRVLLSARIEQR